MTETSPGPGDELDGALRVALFTGNYNHILDGVSRTLNRVVAHLERRGVPVLVFGPTVSDPPVNHQGKLVAVPSIPIPGRAEYRLSLGLPRRVRKQLEDFAPTLVHVATPDLLGMQALRWAKRRGVPAVATYHTHFTSYLDFYRLGWMEDALWSYGRWFYRHCKHIYVPSESMADVLREHGIDRGLRIWERGVETDRFHPRLRDTDWRRSLGIADDEVVVTFVSRLVWEKGLDVYAAVVRRLIESGKRVRPMIVGDGPAREGVTDQLPSGAVFAGFLEGEALSRAYASSDVFLFPSETETFGNVTLEAMASGVPTVCANATGSKQLVQHGETGFLAEPKDVDAFTDYTAALVDDPALRQRFGHAARRAAEPYDWNEVLDRLLEYYHGALDPGDVTST